MFPSVLNIEIVGRIRWCPRVRTSTGSRRNEVDPAARMVELQQPRRPLYCVLPRHRDGRPSSRSGTIEGERMRKQRLALVSMLVASLPVAARADEKRHARDVTPDPGIFFSLAFRGENEVLAVPGRAGFRRSEN